MRIGHELFKLDSKGKLRSWRSEVFDTSDGVFIKVTSGLVGGKFTERVKPIDDSKTKKALPRATTLVENDYTKKLREGYHLSEQQAENAGVLEKPMLAYLYDPSRVSYPCILQPKVNGVRCLYDLKQDKLTSKGLLEYHVDFIRDVCKEYCEEIGVSNLDGELYIPGLKVGDILSAVKTFDNPNRELLEYHLYDLMEPGPFEERFKRLRRDVLPDRLYIVDTVRALHPRQINQFYDKWLEEGWEGLMYRNPKAEYQHKRTYDLMKRKEVFSEEAEVIRYRFERRAEGVNKPVKYLVIFICKYTNGKLFDVVPAWNVDRRHLWYEEYRKADMEKVCSKLDPLTFEYRELTAYGVPHHAVGIDFRPEGT